MHVFILLKKPKEKLKTYPKREYNMYMRSFFFTKLFPFLTDNIALSVSGQYRNCRIRFIYTYTHTSPLPSPLILSRSYSLQIRTRGGGGDGDARASPTTPIEFPIFRAVYPRDDSEPVQSENWPLHTHDIIIYCIYKPASTSDIIQGDSMYYNNICLLGKITLL